MVRVSMLYKINVYSYVMEKDKDTILQLQLQPDQQQLLVKHVKMLIVHHAAMI
jgi:hypothetical protein